MWLLISVLGNMQSEISDVTIPVMSNEINKTANYKASVTRLYWDCRAWGRILVGKVSKAGQAQGSRVLVNKGRGSRSTGWSGDIRLGHDPGFSSFPAGPKPNAWLGLHKSGQHVDRGFQPEGLTGCGLDLTSC